MTRHNTPAKGPHFKQLKNEAQNWPLLRTFVEIDFVIRILG